MRFQQASLIKGGAVMPNRTRLVLQYLTLATFLLVWIALAWSVWRLLSRLGPTARQFGRSATFFLACLAAVELEGVVLEEI
jgi:hypothetical protein